MTLLAKLTSEPAPVSWMLADDMGILNQTLPAITIVRTSSFSCIGCLSPNSHRVMLLGPVTTTHMVDYITGKESEFDKPESFRMSSEQPALCP